MYGIKKHTIHGVEVYLNFLYKNGQDHPKVDVYYYTLSLGSAKNNYFTLDSMIIKNYKRFVPKISRTMLVECLKFGKFILIY